MVKKIPTTKWMVLAVMVLIPIVSIAIAAWYLGFLAETNNFRDPCLGNYSESTCEQEKGCLWNEKAFSCNLKSKCTGAAQQNCGEGCHWDATIKRPNSNLYGLCRPAFYDETSDDSTELK